jgi:hypothetical protein
MRKDAQAGVRTLRKLFDPPLLTSESVKDYEAMLTGFTQAVQPGDFIELLLAKDLADWSWEITRLKLYKMALIEREHLKKQQIEEQRARRRREYREEAAEKAARKHAAEDESKQSEMPEQPVGITDAGEQVAAADIVSDVDDPGEDDVDEFAHSEALQSVIRHFQELDRLLGIALDRRDDTLAQLDFYRHGLGKRLRIVSDDVIDGVVNEPDPTAPSLVTSE